MKNMNENFYDLDEIHETVAEALNFIKEETLVHVFSCEFCRIPLGNCS